MTKFWMRADPSLREVDAIQWMKNGDHPAVDRIHGAGDMIDSLCGHPSHAHGFLKTPEGTVGVCPGDWIVTDARGKHWRYRKTEFSAVFSDNSALGA